KRSRITHHASRFTLPASPSLIDSLSLSSGRDLVLSYLRASYALCAGFGGDPQPDAACSELDGPARSFPRLAERNVRLPRIAGGFVWFALAQSRGAGGWPGQTGGRVAGVGGAGFWLYGIGRCDVARAAWQPRTPHVSRRGGRSADQPHGLQQPWRRSDSKD